MQMATSSVPKVTFRPRDEDGDRDLDDGEDLARLLSFLLFLVVGLTETIFRAVVVPATLVDCPLTLLMTLSEYGL